jgi:hypothetical protein
LASPDIFDTMGIMTTSDGASTTTDLQLAEAMAAAIGAMPAGASHDDRIRVAVAAVMRVLPELSPEQAIEKARLLAAF